MHIVGVSGLIQDNAGRVLLIRTAQAGWELPGGRVEPGEDLFLALRREAFEETGYTIVPGRLVGRLRHRAALNPDNRLPLFGRPRRALARGRRRFAGSTLVHSLRSP